ncbi:MAG: hypothetical protein KBS97_01455, partial [Firmicutes bacterium]|nr:hypothetical protein [Candidatus Fiminaster equi]
MKQEIVYKKIKEILKNGCLTVSLLINELLKQKVFSNRETARTNIFRLLKGEFLASSKPITFLDQGFAIATNDINLASNCKSMILNNYACFNSVVKALDSLGQISYFELEKIFVLKRGDINSLLKIIKSVQYIYNCQNDQTNKCLKSNYENIYDSAYVSLKKHLTSIFINYLQEIN